MEILHIFMRGLVHFVSPARKVTRLLDIEKLRTAGVCQVCGKECVGCPGANTKSSKSFAY